MTVEERRAQVIEHRAEQSRKISGYAAVFNRPAEIRTLDGEFREVVMPGAFTEALNGDVLALAYHDPKQLLGRTSSGTLRLSQDARGLAYEVDMPDTGLGRDIAALIERGDLNGMSFAFVPTDERWSYSGNVAVRSLHRVDLRDVSVVVDPAYIDTSVALRSLGEFRSALGRHNFMAAQRRISERKAKAEAKFRGL